MWVLQNRYNPISNITHQAPPMPPAIRRMLDHLAKVIFSEFNSTSLDVVFVVVVVIIVYFL